MADPEAPDGVAETQVVPQMSEPKTTRFNVNPVVVGQGESAAQPTPPPPTRGPPVSAQQSTVSKPGDDATILPAVDDGDDPAAGLPPGAGHVPLAKRASIPQASAQFQSGNLYDDHYFQRPKIGTVLKQLSRYDPAVQRRQDAPQTGEEKEALLTDKLEGAPAHWSARSSIGSRTQFTLSRHFDFDKWADFDAYRNMTSVRDLTVSRRELQRQQTLDNDDITTSPVHKAKPKQQDASKLGTLFGVFLPCIQNIFGILMFARLPWIVGNAGVVQGFFVVGLCCLTTLLTSISISALATNGKVPGGGAYFIISRTLGPEFGGCLGVLFFIGNALGCSMYLTGAVEMLLLYVAPELTLFGDVTIPADLYNHSRIYGTIMLIIVFAVVCIGIRFVAIAGFVTLITVLVTIALILGGFFITSDSFNGSQACFVGAAPVAKKLAFNMDDSGGGVWCCSKNETCADGRENRLLRAWCYAAGGMSNASAINDTTTPIPKECTEYWEENEVGLKWATPGITSGVLLDNIGPAYQEGEGEIPGFRKLYKNKEEEFYKSDRKKGLLVAEGATSFLVLIGIFFPSVTGILAGSNRSGDLQEPGRAIPRGTISAVLVTSTVYISMVVLLGAVCDGQILRDKRGVSLSLSQGGTLMAGIVAWPNSYIVAIGAFLSTLGAGLQALTSAPRLLHAIASDDIIPMLRPFSKTTSRNEPLRAQFLSAMIAEIGILIASLDAIAPIITMFFLMCYLFLNGICALQSLLRMPNWRPRYRFYHWSISLVGCVLCIAIMFMSSWYMALIAIGIALLVYKYIEYKGAEKEWGDGIRGLSMSAARYALLRMQDQSVIVKNWRPQVLVLANLSDSSEELGSTPQDLNTKHLIHFARQLKAGQGLTMIATVLKGDFIEKAGDAQEVRKRLNRFLVQEKIKAFCEVLVAPNLVNGMSSYIQSAGLGPMRHNTLVLGWPNWQEAMEAKDNEWNWLADTLRNAAAANQAIMLLKPASAFPDCSARLTGTIDVWWIVHDGGLLVLIPFLLLKYKVWQNCKLRIYAVAHLDENSLQMKENLTKLLYDLRIPAEVDVVELTEKDISAYVYQRTLAVQERASILHQMRRTRANSTGAGGDYTSSRLYRQQSGGAGDGGGAGASRQQQRYERQSSETRMAVGGVKRRVTSLHGTPVAAGLVPSSRRLSRKLSTMLGRPAGDQSSKKPKFKRQSSLLTAQPQGPQLHDIVTQHRAEVLEATVTGATEAAARASATTDVDAEATPESNRSASNAARQTSVDEKAEKESDRLAAAAAANAKTNLFTFTPAAMKELLRERVDDSGTQKTTLRRMHNAYRLNETIKNYSSNAALVLANLPSPPKNASGDANYLEYIEVLTEGLNRVLLVRGSGKEVVTINF